MSAIQVALWPAKMVTDPFIVQQDYDEAAATYSRKIMNDGWQSTFDRIISVLKNILPSKEISLPNEGIPLPNKDMSQPNKCIKILDAGCGVGCFQNDLIFLDIMSSYTAVIYLQRC